MQENYRSDYAAFFIRPILRQDSAQRRHISAQRFISSPPIRSQDWAQASHTSAQAAQIDV